jgi:hypothetical protein
MVRMRREKNLYTAIQNKGLLSAFRKKNLRIQNKRRRNTRCVL